MDYHLAVEWIAFAADLTPSNVGKAFAQADVPEELVKGLGYAIANRSRIAMLAPPPGKRTYDPKPYTFVCECGCGETVTVNYVTGRKPKYKNAAHRERVYRRNRKARQKSK